MSLLILKFFILILPVLVSVAFLTLLERKVLSLVGLRVGPNKVSFLGLLQPISDAVKLSNKEINLLGSYSYFLYYFSSLFLFFCSLFMWCMIFFEPVFFSFKLSLMFFFLLLGLGALSSILVGWSSFSKYSLLGSIRTVSQLISYESVLYLCIFFFIYFYSVFSLYNFNFFPFYFFCFMVPFCFYFWMPSFLAELNRTPYDFSEGESELVSGFNTEFGSFCFTLIFLSEYSNIIFFCVLSSFIFFMGSFTFFFFFFFFLLFEFALFCLDFVLMS